MAGGLQQGGDRAGQPGFRGNSHQVSSEACTARWQAHGSPGAPLPAPACHPLPPCLTPVGREHQSLGKGVHRLRVPSAHGLQAAHAGASNRGALRLADQAGERGWTCVLHEPGWRLRLAATTANKQRPVGRHGTVGPPLMYPHLFQGPALRRPAGEEHPQHHRPQRQQHHQRRAHPGGKAGKAVDPAAIGACRVCGFVWGCGGGVVEVVVVVCVRVCVGGGVVGGAMRWESTRQECWWNGNGRS